VPLQRSASCAPNANPACMVCPPPLLVHRASPRPRCAPFQSGTRIVLALWKWNGRAHCGDHLDGRFLYTLTLTDLATGWTECLPLLEKSAAAVLAALAQARTLFPFPLLGIDTDSGSEFLNAEVIGYCEQEQLTFTRGRPGVKNDQCHVEQKNRAVVRETIGCVRLVGV
jgi:hypothetical protein